jgi:hypothetical protein
MISFRPGRYVDESARLAKRVRKAGWDALRRLGFLIRAQAQEEIVVDEKPSPPGEPPHTRQKRLPRSILYGTPSEGLPSVIVGPALHLTGMLGHAMECGGQSLVSSATPNRPPVELAPRPFMAPALAAEKGELPGLLAEKLANI